MGSEGLREALTAESIVLRMLEHVRWVQNEAGPFYRGGYRERAAIAQIAPIIEEYARRTAAQPAAGEAYRRGYADGRAAEIYERTHGEGEGT